MIAFRPEASLLYVNAESCSRNSDGQCTQEWIEDQCSGLHISASPYLDLAGARILHTLHDELAAQGIALQIVGARGRVRDLLRAVGLA